MESKEANMSKERDELIGKLLDITHIAMVDECEAIADFILAREKHHKQTLEMVKNIIEGVENVPSLK